jgi:hypothetical protein
MRREDFLSVWRAEAALADEIVELGTELSIDAFRLKGESHVSLACLLR